MKLEESNIESFKQLIKTPRKSVIAKSQKQSEYIKALKNNDIVISLGPVEQKSFLAVSVAVTLLMEKIDRVILRPAVEAGEKGFLPGDMKEKVDPYLRPSTMLYMNYLEQIKSIKKLKVEKSKSHH